MTFVYPAVFTPKKDGKGYDAYFPDLECCEAEGPDLEDAVENARDAAYNWISLELEEEGDLPAQTHIDDMSLPEGSMVIAWSYWACTVHLSAITSTWPNESEALVCKRESRYRSVIR